MRSQELRTGLLAAFLLLESFQIAAAETVREFVFDDEEGHLVMRFVGLGPDGLSPTQRDEVVNAEFSSMVHDHLRADIRFEVEPVDLEWGPAMEARIRNDLASPGPEFSNVEIECRSESCRIRLEHAARWDIAEQQAQLDRFSLMIDQIIEDNPASFETAYMIAAYEKLRFLPHIKGYLRRCSEC